MDENKATHEEMMLAVEVQVDILYLLTLTLAQIIRKMHSTTDGLNKISALDDIQPEFSLLSMRTTSLHVETCCC